MSEKPSWRPRRIAWLLTHTSLRSAEVPVLRSLGWEVWVQKAFPDDPAYRSCSIDFRWDEGLTLPPEALAELNTFDFYTEEATPSIARHLNEHFDLVVADAFPRKVREALRSFRGPVLARAFGMEHPTSYSAVFFQDCHYRLTRVLRDNYSRFWFSAFYPEVLPYENEILRRRGFHLPISLPEAAWKREGSWQGGDPRVFFVCPSINDHPACREIYDDFKHHFGLLPHVIAGRQDRPVRDPNVTGFLSAEEYGKLYRRVQVMYYHSRQPRHLHYHPIEAMASGMPVVYLRGGLLEKYDTGSQAGACHDEQEAFQKLRAILDGDTGLMAAIRESQRTVVDQWRPSVAREAWSRWLDLFAPDANGTVPAFTLWNNFPPNRLIEEEWDLPYLDPEADQRQSLAWKLCRMAHRYVTAAWSQRTLLPRGIRRIERFRKWLRRWAPSSSNPDSKAA
jgi:hypothetical protein